MTNKCIHEWGEPLRVTRTHSQLECMLCDETKLIPTPKHMLAEPDWENAVEVP